MLEAIYQVYAKTSDKIARRHLASALRRLVYIETLGDLPKLKINTHDLTPEEVHLGTHEGKIPCIKAHRARTNMGLKESKDICEIYFRWKGLTFKGYDINGNFIPH